ncbi:MAG: DUF115 domain-containing protein, partial [Chlamydiae bacterium]|nr:DUF115 domain-containing protein [Chlamydiota bacterium]
MKLPEADWICAIGVSRELYEQHRASLDADPKRRLIFIDIEGVGGEFDHKQVQVFPGGSPLERTHAAKKIGWKSVFQTAAVLDLAGEDAVCSQFEEVLFRQKEAAHLLLSDWADVGESVLKHAFSHWNALPDVRSGLQLKGRFEGIPAIICGAGPSLKKNRHLLDRDKALIFAGGAALNQIEVEPHFAASVDRGASVHFFKQQSFWQAPFFYQSRMNPNNFSLLHGEKLYVPDGCYPAESWLAGQEIFDGGWTVGTFLMSLALFFGCNPIICIGMDLCYEEEEKYPFCKASIDRGSLIETKDRFEKAVWTQKDWLMAAEWMAELSLRRWDRTFINATDGGLRLGGAIKERSLEEALNSCSAETDLAGLIHTEMMSLDWMSIPIDRMNEWKKSVKRCLSLCKKWLKEQRAISWDGEIVYQTFLSPLWQIWGPVFERELEV